MENHGKTRSTTSCVLMWASEFLHTADPSKRCGLIGVCYFLSLCYCPSTACRCIGDADAQWHDHAHKATKTCSRTQTFALGGCCVVLGCSMTINLLVWCFSFSRLFSIRTSFCSPFAEHHHRWGWIIFGVCLLSDKHVKSKGLFPECVDQNAMYTTTLLGLPLSLPQQTICVRDAVANFCTAKTAANGNFYYHPLRSHCVYMCVRTCRSQQKWERKKPTAK